MNPKHRYSGIQSILERAGAEGCLYLCLLSIAEESSNQEFDFFNTVHRHKSKKYIKDDFYVQDAIAILHDLTGFDWKHTRVKTLPKVVPDEMYTVEKWYNPRTGYTHFKRRGYDTLDSSVTVEEGTIVDYYCYTKQE